MSHAIDGRVTFRVLTALPGTAPGEATTTLEVRYRTTVGTQYARVFELDTVTRRLWEIRTQQDDLPPRSARRPVYRCLDRNGDIVPVKVGLTLEVLITAEINRNRSRPTRPTPSLSSLAPMDVL